MNIVKIKDTKDVNANIENFQHFKGKYCYCVNWKYIFTFNDLTESDYVKLSQALSNTPIADTYYADIPYADYTTYIENSLIDLVATEKANIPSKFEEYNKFVPDSELTLDEAKRFRTWLAETLTQLLVDNNDEKILKMLEYYADEMQDATKKQLALFESNPVQGIFGTISGSTCGCNGGQTFSGITGVSNCNPIEIYSKSVYKEMVKVFSLIEFWSEKDPEFLLKVKKYVDYILDANLPLVDYTYKSDLYNCNCLSNTNEGATRAREYLKNLSEAFGLLASRNIEGRKNFISNALTYWALYLYEKMRWY